MDVRNNAPEGYIEAAAFGIFFYGMDDCDENLMKGDSVPTECK